MSELGKPFPKKKSDKLNIPHVKIPQLNKKPLAITFCSNTVFSLYFKIKKKTIHALKSLAFPLHFLFRRDQNHYSNMPLKIMKMCEQILKKTAPQYDSNSF